MSVYLKIAIVGTALMLLSLFIISIEEEMRDVTIQDVNTAYKSDVSHGNSLNSPQDDSDNHTLVLNIPVVGTFTVPFVGELLNFVLDMLKLVYTVLSTLFGILADIALLSTKFPSFLTPLIAMGQLVILVSWYKVLIPAGSG